MYAPSAELASLRGRLLAVEDSLSLARAALADAENLVNGPRRRGLYGSSVSGLAALSAEGLPVDGPIASGFSNARRHPLLHIIRPHLGVDITAPRGTRIAAPAAGRVTFVGWKLSLGLSIEIQHADGVMTRYAHCRLALVRVGDRVTRGQMIATVGSSGLTTGPHLHYEVWVRDHPVDPLLFRLARTADTAAVSGAQPAVATPAVTVPR
jgi:murein DD-endopeptidase MepM/ murein hydrolase activator NlpD